MDEQGQVTRRFRCFEPRQSGEGRVRGNLVEDRPHSVRPLGMTGTRMLVLVVVANECDWDAHACATAARTSSIRSRSFRAARGGAFRCCGEPAAHRDDHAPAAGVEPCGHRFLERTALGSHAREQQRCVRRGGPDGGYRLGPGRTHDETHAPTGIPAEAQLHDAGTHRHARFQPGIEQVDGARIAAPRYQQRSAIRPLQEWQHRIAAEERIDGHDVGAEHVEQRPRVRLGGVAHVPALCIEDQDAIARDVRAKALEDRVPGGAELLEERQVRLEGADVLEGLVHQLEHSVLGIGGAREPVWIEAATEERPGRFDARVQACDECHGATRPPSTCSVGSHPDPRAGSTASRCGPCTSTRSEDRRGPSSHRGSPRRDGKSVSPLRRSRTGLSPPSVLRYCHGRDANRRPEPARGPPGVVAAPAARAGRAR